MNVYLVTIHRGPIKHFSLNKMLITTNSYHLATATTAATEIISIVMVRVSEINVVKSHQLTYDNFSIIFIKTIQRHCVKSMQVYL